MFAGGGGVGVGAIIGIVIGILLIAVLVTAAFIYKRRNASGIYKQGTYFQTEIHLKKKSCYTHPNII